MDKIFIYGTLKDINLREKLTGRKIPVTSKAFLSGFSLTKIEDNGIKYPAIYKNKNSDSLINGEIIEVSPAELKIIDDYEGDLYSREKITLNNSETVWSYIKK